MCSMRWTVLKTWPETHWLWLCYLWVNTNIYYTVRLSICLFVCLFAFGAKTTKQNATKLSGIIKSGSRSVIHGLKSPVLQFLKRYPSISGFRSRLTAILLIIAHWLLVIGRFDSLSSNGRRYSSYPPLLTAKILRISLGPTCCSRSLPVLL